MSKETKGLILIWCISFFVVLPAFWGVLYVQNLCKEQVEGEYYGKEPTAVKSKALYNEKAPN